MIRLVVDLAKGKRPKRPLEQSTVRVLAEPAGGKMPLANPSPTSAGISGGSGGASRGGKPIGVRSDGTPIYETELKDRSERGAASGLVGQTQKEFAKRHPKLFVKAEFFSAEPSVLHKGGVPIGTIHEWHDGSYQKKDEGVWVPVTTPGHPDHPADQQGEPIGGAVPIAGAKPTNHPWRAQFGQYGITSGFPPADMHPSKVQVDLSGDVHSHWILRHRHPEKGHVVNAYSKEYHRRNAAQKWKRLEKITKTGRKNILRDLDKVIAAGTKGKRKFDQEQEAALILRTLAETASRIGTSDTSKARGISTLRAENIKVSGDTVHFDFIGKYGVRNTPSVKNKNIAKAYQKILKGKGPSDKVFTASNHFFARRYLQNMTKLDIIPHDFRSWLATRWAADEFDKVTPPKIPRKLGAAKRLANKLILDVATTVAMRLYNRPNNTRDSYIHPKVINAWLSKHNFPEQLQKAHRDMRSTFDIAFSTPAEHHPQIPIEQETEAYPLPDWVKVPDDLYKAIPASGIAGAAKEYLSGRRPLTMSELTHTLKNGHYSIISAGRNPNHPKEANLPDDHPKFQARHEKLRQDLDRHHFGYTEVDGHYGGRERSFIVHHRGDSPKLSSPGYMVHHRDTSEHQIVRNLAKKHNQESVIHSKNGIHELHYTSGNHAGEHHKGEGHELKSHAGDFYSAMPEIGAASRFSLNFNWDKYHQFQHAMHKGNLDLFVKALTKEEVEEESKRKLFTPGLAVPLTPDLPNVGRDWDNEVDDDEEPEKEEPEDDEEEESSNEESETEGSFSSPFGRVVAQRRHLGRSIDLFIRADS